MAVRPLSNASKHSLLRGSVPGIPRRRVCQRDIIPQGLGRGNSTAAPQSEVSGQTIARHASEPLHPLALSDLVMHGRPPLSEAALLDSARFTLSLLPARLAHRLQAIQNLPYIVVSNPHISTIYGIYKHSLSTLLPFYNAGIFSAEDEAAFTEVLADLVQTHTNTIPTLARGLKSCERYLGDGEGRIGGRFLDDHLRARIGTRLVAEQHIALHLASKSLPTQQQQLLLYGGGLSGGNGPASGPPEDFVGVIDTALSPVAVLRGCESFVGELCELRYGVRPSVVINGDVDARIAHVPTHLEYVLTELLKNAFRVLVERGREREPVEVTIALGKDGLQGGKDGTGDPTRGGRGGVASNAHRSNSMLTIRIRDQGGGIAPEVLPYIWDYSFTTFKEDDGATGLGTISAAGTENSSIAGLGYGLPLGRAYAEYFGGELNVESLWHWGTDVYLRLKGLEMDVLDR